jgi:hypothetical protein
MTAALDKPFCNKRLCWPICNLQSGIHRVSDAYDGSRVASAHGVGAPELSRVAERRLRTPPTEIG